MTVYKRTILVICLTLVAAVVVLYISSQLVLLKSYEQVEVQETGQHIQQALNTFNADIIAFKTLAQNWARWDSMRDFIRRPQTRSSQEFANEYINNTFITADLDVAVFLNTKGEITSFKAVDSRTRKEIEPPAALLDELELGNPLLDHPDINHEVTGIMSLPQGYLEVVSLPVSNTRGVGRVNGYLVWGRYITDSVVMRVANILDTHVELHPYSTTLLEGIKTTAVAANSYFVQPIDETHVNGYSVINDVFGNPALIMQVELPRLTYIQGKSIINYFLVSLVIVVLVFAGILLWLLERSVLSRLAALSASVSYIRRSHDLTAPITVTGDDELGNLAFGLKDMLASLGQSQTRLEESNRELEKRVTERTIDLSQANTRLQEEIKERKQAQSDLARARDQAIEALNLKTQILASISHDSRVPLTTINLNTERLQLGHFGPVTPEQRNVLGSVLTSARELLSFINQLLEDARIGSGKVQLAHVPLDPRQVLDDVMTMLQPVAENKGVELTSEVASELPDSILGDPARLKQIITNLTDNALKYTDKGAVKVRMSCPDTGHWSLQVQDSGPGIPEDLQQRIFEAFWQIKSTATHETNRGVGLGLSIVRQLVTLMDGEINVESSPNCGSTFTIVLPIVVETLEQRVPELAVQPG
ncbi:MAG: ATP-binding protein [Anaerolineae bacterium]